MTCHAPYRPRKRVLVDPAQSVGRFAPADPLAKARQLPAVKPHQTRVYTEAQKRNPPCHGRNQRPLCSQFQPQDLSKETPDGRQSVVQARLVIGEHGEIVHIAKIPWKTQSVLDEMVQFPQVEIGEVLAGQVADRHALARPATRKRMIDDAVQQGQELLVLELSAANGLENLVVHAFEVGAHVAQQHIT